MGMKSIWDRENLPPIGCEVLIHLSSNKAWVRHVVAGHKVSPMPDSMGYRVEIQLDKSDDPRSWKNARLLGDIRPVDDIESVLEAQADKLEDLQDKAKRYSDLLFGIEKITLEDDIDHKQVVDSILALLEKNTA